MPNVTYWSPKKTKRFCHTSQPIAEPELWGPVPKRPNPKCLTSPTEALRKQSPSQNLSSEERFQNGRTQSAYNVTYWSPKKTKRFCHTSQPIAEPELWGAVPKRPNPKCLTSPTEALRKQRDFATPASSSQNLSSEDRFPWALRSGSETAEPKVPNVTYWSPKKTTRFCHTSHPIAEPELWGAVPKRPNPKCLTSPTEALRKQRDFATPASPSEERFRNGRTQSA